MDLPVAPVKATRKSPALMTIFGQSKVGKTTALAKLDDCLIIDTEDGSDFVEALKVKANSMKDLLEISKALEASDHRYKFIALDTLDMIYTWSEKAVCASEGVKDVSDLGYGKGWALARENVLKVIQTFKRHTDHLILIGHRKKTISDENPTFSLNSLDLVGKLKNIIAASSDAIGYMYRTPIDPETKSGGDLRITFQTEDRVEAGARPDHLRGKDLPLDWSKIFID